MEIGRPIKIVAHDDFGLNNETFNCGVTVLFLLYRRVVFISTIFTL